MAYSDRTVHVYRALIGQLTNMRNLEKKLRAGREFIDTWHADTWQILFETVHVYRAGTCHVEMINCEKVRLPRQICNFCVSTVSRMESSFSVSRKCFFLHLPLQAQDSSDCDLELQTVSLAELPRHPGKFLQEWAGLPRMTSVNCSLVDTVLKPTQHATWQKLTCGIT